MRLRKLAAVSTLALAAAGLTAVTAPAANAAGSGAFVCTVPIFGTPTDFEFATAGDTNLPATMAPGQAAPVTGSLTVTVPANLAELAYSALEARTADGTTNWNVSTGPSAGVIPSTPIKQTGPLVLTVPLSAGTFKAPASGSGSVTVTGYTGQIKLKKADGTEAMTIDATCKPKAGALVLDTVAVKAPPVVAAKTSTSVKAKGAKGKATITVKVAGAKTGKVKIAVKGKKKVNKTVAVKNGVAKVTLKKLKKGKYKVQASYLATPTAKASTSKTVSFKVK